MTPVEELRAPPPGALEGVSLRMQQGDTLFVRYVQNPELNTEATVRPDGRITLPLLGELPAAGLTLAELRTRISQSYKEFVDRTGYGQLLKEGDDLELRFVNNPELNLGTRIRSDGRISLPLLGDVRAAGVAPDILREQLVIRYAKYIRHPDLALLPGSGAAKRLYTDERLISIALAKQGDRNVYVGGEVPRAGAIEHRGYLTAWQAITEAGGVSKTGDLSNVVVLRRGQYEQGEWIRINLDSSLTGQGLQNDVVLRPGDVVVVPKSGAAKVNLWVQQYVREALPILTTGYIAIIPVVQAPETVPVPQASSGTSPAPAPQSGSTPGVVP